jgi:hypothetical protein
MKNWFLSFWNDPAKFQGAVRAGAIVGAGLIQTGAVPLPGFMGGWVGALLPYVLTALGIAGTPTKVAANG